MRRIQLLLVATSIMSIALAEVKIVTCVGDSITQYGGYPEALQKILGADWQVVNAGKGGATILEGSLFPYDQQKQYQKALKSNPDKVVIILGVNDANPRWWENPERKRSHQGSSKEEFKERYIELIRELQQLPKKPEVILATPLPVFPHVGKEFMTQRMLAKGKTYSEEAWQQLKQERQGRQTNLQQSIIPLIKEIAASEGLPLIDLNALMQNAKEHCTDGVHYRKEAAPIYAQLISQAL